MNTRYLAFIGFLLAPLVLITALGGIYLPSTYALETASWAAQGIGQDWVNLIFVVPWLILVSVKAYQGSVRAVLLLGGAFVYIFYSYILYTLSVHFNSLFLFYCATLGLSFFGLMGLLLSSANTATHVWSSKEPFKPAIYFQVAISVIFSILWLAQILPALINGERPVGLDEVGLMTNPVHVLDLSLLLPAMLISAYQLKNKTPLGLVLTPMMLSFSVLMALAIGGMMIVMHLRGLPIETVIAGLMLFLSLLSLIVLILMMGRYNSTSHKVE